MKAKLATTVLTVLAVIMAVTVSPSQTSPSVASAADKSVSSAKNIGNGRPACGPGGLNGALCNGKGPVGTGCARDARTVQENSGYDVDHGQWIIELRYSPSCRTAWARGSIAKPVANYPGVVGPQEVEMLILNSNGKQYVARFSRTGSNGLKYNWTSMVNDRGISAIACIGVSDGCTDAF